MITAVDYPTLRPKGKFLFIILTVLMLAFLTIAGLVIYLDQKSPSKEFSKTIDEIKLVTKGDTTLERYITEINSPKLAKKDKYKSLTNISFYLSGQYTQTHNPGLRKVVNTDLNSFAKKNFSEYYQPSDFEVPCSDTVCGREITEEFQNIISIIEKSKMDNIDKEIILLNLKTVGYKPASDKGNAVIGLTIVIQQLEDTKDTNASEAARLLKEYLKDTYKLEYEN